VDRRPRAGNASERHGFLRSMISQMLLLPLTWPWHLILDFDITSMLLMFRGERGWPLTHRFFNASTPKDKDPQGCSFAHKQLRCGIESSPGEPGYFVRATPAKREKGRPGTGTRGPHMYRTVRSLSGFYDHDEGFNVWEKNFAGLFEREGRRKKRQVFPRY